MVVLSISGCQTIPKQALLVGSKNLEHRQLQMRKYDSSDESTIVLAAAGVLQDLGFTIDRSETKLGVIVASKDRTAVDSGQVALATTAVVLAALAGSSSNAYQQIDDIQKISASVVTSTSVNMNQIVVRTTFQRIVWNKAGNVSKMESITDAGLYQQFYEKLSKSIFLEAHKI